MFSRHLTKEAFIDYIYLCMCVCVSVCAYLLKLLLDLHGGYFLSSSVPNWQALGAGLPPESCGRERERWGEGVALHLVVGSIVSFSRPEQARLLPYPS